MKLTIDNIWTYYEFDFSDRQLFDTEKVAKELRAELTIALPYNPRGRNHFEKNMTKCYVLSGPRFPTGFLPNVTKWLTDKEIEYTLEDQREPLNFNPVYSFDDFKLYDIQNKALIASKTYVDDLPFYRGIINAATNYGKTILMVAYWYSLGKPKTVILIHSALGFKSLYDGLSKFIGKDKIGYFKSNKFDIDKPIVLVMSATFARRLKAKKPNVLKLATDARLLIWDECHQAGNQTSVNIARSFKNAFARYYMSGTSLLGGNIVSKVNRLAYSGNILYTASKKELQDQGLSLKPKIIFHWNNVYDLSHKFVDLTEEMRHLIYYNFLRIDTLLQDIKSSDKYTLISFRDKANSHGYSIYQALEKEGYNVAYVDGDRCLYKDQEYRKIEIVDMFTKGVFQILVASTVIKEALNIPLIERLYLVAAGKDKVYLSQILGRLERLYSNIEDENIRKVVMERSGDIFEVHDFIDAGNFVWSHSKARLKYYASEEFDLDLSNIPDLIPGKYKRFLNKYRNKL